MLLEPTREETKAIAALKRLAKKWPKSLWLYAGGGSLAIMRGDHEGGHHLTASGGVDPDYQLDTVHIDSDGGDW